MKRRGKTRPADKAENLLNQLKKKKSNQRKLLNGWRRKPTNRLSADVPKNEEKSLRPKEIKFDTWEDLLKWEPGARGGWSH